MSEENEPQAFLIKYPAGFNIKKLNGMTVTLPDTGKILLRQKDGDEIIAINELEEELGECLRSKLTVLEKAPKGKAVPSRNVRISRIFKLRKCPVRHSSKGKSSA